MEIGIIVMRAVLLHVNFKKENVYVINNSFKIETAEDKTRFIIPKKEMIIELINLSQVTLPKLCPCFSQQFFALR